MKYIVLSKGTRFRYNNLDTAIKVYNLIENTNKCLMVFKDGSWHKRNQVKFIGSTVIALNPGLAG